MTGRHEHLSLLTFVLTGIRIAVTEQLPAARRRRRVDRALRVHADEAIALTSSARLRLVGGGRR